MSASLFEEGNMLPVERHVSPRTRHVHNALRNEEVRFNKERAREVLGTLYCAFTRNNNDREHIVRTAPQWKYRPRELEVGSPEHRVWLLLAAATDAREDSASVYRAHELLWRDARPHLALWGAPRSTRELYTPQVLEWTREDYERALAKCRIGNPKRTIAWWPQRARTLWRIWNGDPFAMFRDGGVDDFIRWKYAEEVDPFPGVGPKIASLIAIFLEEVGMSPVSDAFPVDVHVQSLALSLQLVDMSRPGPITNETLEEILRPELSLLCKEEEWSRIALSHALWFRGNGGCRVCARSFRMEHECPVYHECVGRFGTRSYFRMGLWFPDVPPGQKGGTQRFHVPRDGLFQFAGE